MITINKENNTLNIDGNIYPEHRDDICKYVDNYTKIYHFPRTL